MGRIGCNIGGDGDDWNSPPGSSSATFAAKIEAQVVYMLGPLAADARLVKALTDSLTRTLGDGYHFVQNTDAIRTAFSRYKIKESGK